MFFLFPFTDSTDGITPTVGFLNSSFSLYRFHVTLFDVGGGARIRSIWKNYYAEVRNIIVNSSYSVCCRGLYMHNTYHFIIRYFLSHS